MTYPDSSRTRGTDQDRDAVEARPPDEVLGALTHRPVAAGEVARVTSQLDDGAPRQAAVLGAARVGPATSQLEAAAGEPQAPEPRPRAPHPARIGRYELRGVLSERGMGAVYDARDTELDRAVALKVLRTGDAPGLADRLVRESRLMAKVVDPSVITVYDVGRDGDTVFIAMELSRGPTLTAWLASRALDWRGIVALFERAGRGLAAAHGAGIVHRDFQPDNVLVARGGARVVVAGFSIAREAAPGVVDAADPVAEAAELTCSAAFGTPAYMAPEQLAGEPADHRADVFAFSVSLWEALFRRRPFPGGTLAELTQAMRQPVAPPPPCAMRVPARLMRALRIGLAVDPSDRWPDMRAMLGELAAIRARGRRLVLVAGAVGLVGLGIAAVLAATRPAPAIDRCDLGLAQLSEAYNPGLAGQIRDALAAEPTIRDEVLGRLDAAAGAWRTTQASICRAEREISENATTAACLDARRQELAGTVEALIGNGAAGAPYAARLSTFVGDPAACAVPAAGLLFARVPAARQLGHDVSALRGRLADAVGALRRSDCRQALALAEPAAVDAGAMWPPVSAEALYLLGVVQRRCGDARRGTATLLDAAGTAERAHHDEYAAQTWIELMSVSLFDQGDPHRALEYLQYAEAVSERIGRPAATMVQLEYLRGSALGAVHRYPEAEAAMRQAIALAQLPGSPMRVAQPIQGLGLLSNDQGRYADAVAAYRQAIEVLPRSPSGEIQAQAVYFDQLAYNLALLGNAREAEPIARQAIEIAERSRVGAPLERPSARLTHAQVLRELGRDREALVEATTAVDAVATSLGKRSERYGEALGAQGDILVGLGRYAEAEAVLARACDIAAFTRGDADAEVAWCGVAHGAALLGLHRDAQALVRLDHDVASLVNSYGESHPRVGEALLTRGLAHASLGHRPLAIADFEHAIAVLAAKQVDPGYLAAAKWQLGKQLRASQPERAHREIAEGVARFATANGRWARQHAEAASWLAGHAR